MFFRDKNNIEKEMKEHKSQFVTTQTDFEEALKKLIDNNPNLEEIYITTDGLYEKINDHECKKFKDNEYELSYDDLEKLADALSKNHTLKSLIIHNQSIKDIGVEVLTKALCSNNKIPLKHLDLTGNKISWVGAYFLAELLSKKNSSLKYLNLTFNQIGDSGAARFAKILEDNSTLESLLLSTNQITDKSILLLASAIEINKTLKTLFLFSNKISDLGAAQLLESIKVNKTLTKLTLLFQFNEKNIRNEISKSLLDEVNSQLNFNKSYSPLNLRI